MMTKRIPSIQLLFTLTLVCFTIFTQSNVFAQAGSYTGSSSNRLNAPKNNTNYALTSTNFTVQLSMPDGVSASTGASANTSGLTTSTSPSLATFTSNYNTINSSSSKGYYITRSATQPFTIGNTVTIVNNNRALISSATVG